MRKLEIEPITRVSEILATSLSNDEIKLLRAVRTYPYGLTALELQQLVDLRLIEIQSTTTTPEVTQLGMDVLMSEALRRQDVLKQDAA